MMVAHVSRLLFALLLLAGLVAAAPAQARVPMAVCIAPVHAGDTPARLFASPARFDCTTLQKRLGSGDYWAVSQRLPALNAESRDLSVSFASLWQGAVTLHVRYADGHITATRFTSATASRYLRLGATFAIPLPAATTRPVQVLWHIERAANVRGILLGAAIVQDDELAATQILLALLYGTFGGVAIALIIYNLALWGAMRQPFQPVYCLLVLCLLGYAVSSSGALGQMMPWLDNNDRLRVNVLLVAASAIAAVVFARSFFEPRVFAGWLTRSTDAVIGSIAASATLYAALAPWRVQLLDKLIVLSYMLLLALVAAILVRAWRNKSNYLRLFALAWGAPIAFCGLRIASALNLIAWNFWVDHSTTMSMMFEALLSSLAIAYRIRLLGRERDEAREQEIAARLLADTDPLTGLLNRRAFLARAIGREDEQLLLIVDIDHFKHVNETIGHDGGDEVLRLVARALRSTVPPEALIARIGGEEFAIVAPLSAGLAPEAILAALRRTRMPYDLTVTASIGSCTGALMRETDWKRLYCNADRALFAAKAAGRDRSRDSRSLAA